MKNKKLLLVSAIVLSLLQTGFLGWMIAVRAAILRDGTQVLLKVDPVDPRDFLRGDYVRLGYDITTIPVGIVANAGDRDADSGRQVIFVRLRPGADGYWRAISATLGTPSATQPGEIEADIKGHVVTSWSADNEASLRVDYGIERFYLPEGEGLAIQNDMRERPFSMRVALGRDGAAQIKALVDRGKNVFEEPLY